MGSGESKSALIGSSIALAYIFFIEQHKPGNILLSDTIRIFVGYITGNPWCNNKLPEREDMEYLKALKEDGLKALKEYGYMYRNHEKESIQ